MKNSKSMIQNALILFTAMIITKLIGAVLKIPLGNILGGLGMSYFSTAYHVFSPVYALTTAALPTVITKLVAENISAGNIQNIRKLRRVAFRVSLLLGFFGMITILVITTPFAIFVANSPKSIPAMLVIAPALFFCCISAVYRGYFEGLRNMLPTAISQVVESVIKASLGIFASYYILAKTNSLPYAAAAAVFGITIGELCGFLFLSIRSRFFSDGITEKEFKTSAVPESAWQLLKKIYKEMFPITIAAMVINLSSFIDLLTITNTINQSIIENRSYFLENFVYEQPQQIALSELGNFIYGSYSGIVSSLFGLITAMTAMVSRSAIPNVAVSLYSNDYKGLHKNLSIIFRGTFAIGFPLCMGMAVLSEPILTLLYSSKPLEILICIKPLFILSLFGMSLCLSGALFNIFLSIGRPDLIIKLTLIGCILKLGGNIFFIRIPEFNITGAAISTVLCYSAISIIGAVILKKIVKVHLSILPHFIKSLFNSICSGLGAYITYHHILININPWLKMAGAVSAAGLVYLSLFVVTDFNVINKIIKRRAAVGKIPPLLKR